MAEETFIALVIFWIVMVLGSLLLDNIRDAQRAYRMQQSSQENQRARVRLQYLFGDDYPDTGISTPLEKRTPKAPIGEL